MGLTGRSRYNYFFLWKKNPFWQKQKPHSNKLSRLMIRQQNMIVLFCLFKLLLGTGWGKRMVTLFDCFRMTRHNSWRVVPVYLNPIFPFFNTIKLILIYNENSFHDSFIRYYYNRCPVVVLINHVVYESFWGFLIINKHLRWRLWKRNRIVDNSIKTFSL